MINVYYSTQSGTSEHLATQLANYLRLNLQGVDLENAPVHLDTVGNISNIQDLTKAKINIFFISSYGDGEPCDDAIDFFNELPKSELKISYSLFGCGNSQYDDYQAMAIKLDQLLKSSGSQLVGSISYSDESKDIIDDVYEEWLFDYLKPLVEFLGTDKWSIYETNDYKPVYVLKESTKSFQKSKVRPPYHESNPFLTQLDLSKTFFKNDDQLLLTSVSLTGSKLKYTTGDHIGIIPRNDQIQVEQLLNKLGVENIDQVLSIQPLNRMDAVWFPQTITYRELFLKYIEVNSVLSRRFIKGLLKFSEGQEHALILSLISNKDYFFEEVTKDKLTLLKFITKFQLKTLIPISYIIENFGKLKPRFFSIASSNSFSPDSCDIIIKLIKEETFQGTLSLWIEQIAKQMAVNEIPVFTRKSKFKLPFDLSKPIVLIAAGTGIAPILGFLADLNKNHQKVTKVFVCYGLRSMEYSLIDENEFSNLLGDNKLDIRYAQSRHRSEPKKYVQDILKTHQETIQDYLKTQQGSCFVCGDASGMAHGVSRSLVEIFGSGRVGDSHLKLMKTMGRFKEDVW